MVDLIAFFQNLSTAPMKDGTNLLYDEILAKDNIWWGNCMDHIQVVYPTNKPSFHNKNAPLLTQAQANIIRHTPECKARLERATERFLEYLIHEDMSKFNHNHLRVTRLIECNRLIQGWDKAFDVHQRVIHVIQPFMSLTICKFWNEALSIRF